MYSAKTYFFWALVLYVRAFRWFEYGLLRLMRAPINSIIRRKAAEHGIIINGGEPCGDRRSEDGGLGLIHIAVHNPNTFIRVINGATIGLVQSYMEAWWECAQLEELALRIGDLLEGVKPHPMMRLMDWITLNADDGQRPWEGVRDGWVTQVGTDFFNTMLGAHKLYMCGAWKTADTLEQAQTDNMTLLGAKLMLGPGMRLLDLGCGYGALTRFLAEKFNIEAVGVTNSPEEAANAKSKQDASNNVKIIESDYRDLPGKFDRVVCVQMMEHLGGPRHYPQLFRKMDSLLAPDGLLVIQTTVITVQSPIRCDPFGRKYFLLNSVAPHPLEILKAAEGAGFIAEDVHNIGAGLERTVLAYEANMERGWKETLSAKYEMKYYRMFKFYLKVYIAAVRSRRVQMWQLVLSKRETGPGVGVGVGAAGGGGGGYESVR